MISTSTQFRIMAPTFFVFVITVFALAANAQQIRMYDHNNYGGFQYATRITTSCQTLPLRYWNKVASIKTDRCVILYSHSDCKGSSFRLEAGNHPGLPYFYDDTDSFRACSDVSESSPYRDLRTRFYDHNNFGNILIDMPISQQCQTLPDWAWNKAASIKTDVCVLLYSHSGCNGRAFRLEKGSHSTLPYFYDDTDSYKPCDVNSVLKDFRLTVKVIKFDVAKGSSGIAGVADLDMGATQIFRNNGSAIILQRYSVSKEVSEVVEMERFVATKEYHKFYVDASASFSYSAGIPVIAQTKVSASLKTGYLFERTRNEEVTTRYRSETKKAFRLDQDIRVPPCSVYELSSIVKLSTGYPVDYVVHAHVTGEYTGHRLTASEIRSKLASGMTYVRTVDGYTVEVRFSKSLKVDFGLFTESIGNGYPLRGCSWYP